MTSSGVSGPHPSVVSQRDEGENRCRRILFDGLNLGLAQGTGIATYARVLTRVAHCLGYDVDVVYSTPFTPATDPLLREIAFFDEKRTPNGQLGVSLTPRRIVQSVVD